ncbi:Unknown protein [Striga hermonthica]|uniref:DUF4378 domain-containing protein n=1 Tax=Striga hermonthica TaxID=68872 RepID=A0A9N7NMJ4_STRHE|nr:Unknown protein [Striga hermonthica]
MDEQLCEKNELKCMWAGILSILNSSYQGHRPSPFRMISSRRAAKTNVSANKSRKLDDDSPVGFDEKCRKLQNKEANIGIEKRSVRNLIQDDMYIDSHENKKISKLVDRPIKTHKEARKTSRLRANQSSFESNAKCSINTQPSSTSPEVDEEIMQQARMSVKAFIDEMFVDSKLVIREENPTSNEPLPFSDALHVLSSYKKDSDCSIIRPSHKASHGKIRKPAVFFSVKDIKHKLKHLRKDALPHKRSHSGNDCKFSFSSKNGKEKARKRVEFKEAEKNTRKKIDFSISGFSNSDKTNSFLTRRSTDEDSSSHDSSIFETGDTRFNDEPQVTETENTVITSSASGSVSENETFTSTTDEQESPISVLKQVFFTEVANISPSNTILQTGRRKRPHHKRIFFESCSIESYPQDDQPIGEKDFISKYVHWLLQSSFLNWEKLSELGPRPERLLLHSYSFNETELFASSRYINHRLLFDHVEEVLHEIHRSHFSFFPRQEVLKHEKSVLPLEKLVLDEIMRKPSAYNLQLTSTEGRTGNELLTSDVLDSRSWIDARTEAEYIIVHISENILEECVLDIILESHS